MNALSTSTRVIAAVAAAVYFAVVTREPGPAGAQPQALPEIRLLAVIVVDQLRAQYLDDYRHLFTAGIGRLLKEGAWYQRAQYPYLNTVTCAGHATIGTGTHPYRHGMVLNTWYDRAEQRTTTCTADGAAGEFSYSGLKPAEGDSAHRLMVPTLAEQIRQRFNGRIVALSLKSRSTVPVVGREADALTWFDDRGGWMTSLAYGRPSPELQSFIAGAPPAGDLRKTWRRSLPLSAYQFEDEGLGEQPVIGWGRTFPHPLRGSSGKADAPFYTRWQRSPYSDEYLGRMAATMIDSLQLGRREAVDFLSVSFSALDLVGHAYGPRSHEVQDLLVRLDRTIGRLLDHLDSRVGRHRYVLALSADHGVSDVPEQTADGGRLTNAEIKIALQDVLVEALGPGEHVASNQYTDHYLSDAVAQRIRGDSGLREVLLEALRKLPLTERAFYGEHLASAEARRSPDPAVRAAALSYYPGRSGDLIVVPRRHWTASTAATSHGTANDYDQRVPIIVLGGRPGVLQTDASPADIAPTLGAAVDIQMTGIDGRVLR